jgi:hypothetical protein
VTQQDSATAELARLREETATSRRHARLALALAAAALLLAATLYF